ncbi:MAG TPA: TetR family transcriptional regulator C-terminal domain-containing protein [Steroidobacteraceae bacterium]
MPKQVDHDRRRADIAALAVEVIQREGAGSATVRRISQQGGFSIGVITHYFRDKDELIASAFNWLADQSFLALEQSLARAAPGRERLRAALEFMVPSSGARSHPAVWLSLWSGAMHNPQLADVHRRYYRRWRRILARCVAEAVHRREVRAPRAGNDVVDLLAAGVDGLWLAVTFEGRRFSAARRRQLVTNLMTAVLTLEDAR